MSMCFDAKKTGVFTQDAHAISKHAWPCINPGEWPRRPRGCRLRLSTTRRALTKGTRSSARNISRRPMASATSAPVAGITSQVLRIPFSSWLRRTPRENGFERRTKKDFAHFLDLAKGSAGEVRSMLYLGEDRGYIAAKAAEPLRADYKDLSKSIGALAASLRRLQ